MKNYYAILETAPGSEPDEIRRAYRRVISQKLDDPIAFAEAAEAFHTLDDPTRRSNYDRTASGLAQEPLMESTVFMGATQQGPRHCPVNAGGQCPVLRDGVTPGEQYCPECGFALAEMPADGFDAAAAAQSETLPYLEEQTGKQHRLKMGVNTVGREAGDVLVPDKTVSRQHAQIEVTEESVINIQDLGSTNGTQINGERLEPNTPRIARAGDAVRFGSVRLTLLVPGASSEPHDTTIERTAILGEAAPLEETIARLIGAQGREIDLAAGTTTFGRTPENAVVLSDDPYISGRHGQIVIGEDGTAQVIDVGSTNGTTLNGVRLTPQTPLALASGDEIKFGGSAFRYEPIVAPAEGEEG